MVLYGCAPGGRAPLCYVAIGSRELITAQGRCDTLWPRGLDIQCRLPAADDREAPWYIDPCSSPYARHETPGQHYTVPETNLGGLRQEVNTYSASSRESHSFHTCRLVTLSLTASTPAMCLSISPPHALCLAVISASALPCWRFAWPDVVAEPAAESTPCPHRKPCWGLTLRLSGSASSPAIMQNTTSRRTKP